MECSRSLAPLSQLSIIWQNQSWTDSSFLTLLSCLERIHQSLHSCLERIYHSLHSCLERIHHSLHSCLERINNSLHSCLEWIHLPYTAVFNGFIIPYTTVLNGFIITYTAVCSSPRAILTLFPLLPELWDTVSLFLGFLRLDRIGLFIDAAELKDPVDPILITELWVELSDSLDPAHGPVGKLGLTPPPLLPMGLEETPIPELSGRAGI